eukprot:1196316-Prorocentrum_minimum.AAC.1
MVLEEVTHAPGYTSFVAPELAREYNEGKDWYGSERQLAKWGWVLGCFLGGTARVVEPELVGEGECLFGGVDE